MIIKEAEKKYGKEMAMLIWDNFDLSNIEVSDSPEGLDVANHEWEAVYYTLI